MILARKTAPRKRLRFGPWVPVAVSGLMLLTTADVFAQTYVGSGQPSVFVNTQVLNSLGPGPTPYGGYGAYNPYAAPYAGAPAVAPGAQQPYYVTRPGTLLFPPPTYPRSRVTFAQPSVALTPPAGYAATATAPGITLTEPAPLPRPPQVGLAPQPAPTAPVEPATMPSLTAPEPAPAPTPPEPSTRLAERSPDPPAPPAPEPESEAPAIPAIPPPDIASESETAPTPPPPPAPQLAEAPPAPEPAPPPAPEPEQAAEAAPLPPAPPPPSAESETLSPPPPPAAAESVTTATSEPAPADPPQTAALPPAGLDDEEGLRLMFGEGSAELAEEAKSNLQGLAATLMKDGNARVQLLAYASSPDDNASRARRLSLSRALAVRAYLIDQGVRSTRMDVRALGNKIEDGPPDRVDILPARR